MKGTASSFGSGGINIGGNGSLIIDQVSNASMSNSFSGSGAMSKIGSGNVTLNSYSPDFNGQVDVLAGGLGISGDMSNARFNAQNGGTIYGTGSVGPTTIGDGGALAPAGPGAVGTISINGELSMGAGSTFSATGTGQEIGSSVNVNGSNRNILASSFANVSGNVSLTGGIAALTVAPGSVLRVNQVYRLIEATGNISGQFDLLSANLGSQYIFLDPRLFYTNNLVGVALDRNNTSFTILSRSRNEFASGAALDRLPSGNVLSLAVAGLDINDARSALNAASGEIHASAVTALIEDAFMLRETVAERLSSADCDGPYSSESIQTAALSEKAPSNRCNQDRLVLWYQAYGSLGRNFGDGNVATMNHISAGFLMGADVPVFSTARIGALIGYSNDSFHVSSGRDSLGHSNNVTIGAYGGNHWGRINLRLGANYTLNMMSMSRAVNFNGYSGSKLNADYLSGTAQGFGEIGYRMRGRKIAFEPFAGLSYVSVQSGSFQEKGSIEALKGRSFTKGVTFSTFGLRSSAFYRIGRTILMPRLMIGYRHSFGSLSPAAPMRFAASNDAAMRIAGTLLASDVAVVDAGFNLRVTDQIDVGLFYLGQYGVKATDSGLKGSLHVTF
ncbi:MAG: autotransporter domain-containing protein [Acetobacteraceae bacterium]